MGGGFERSSVQAMMLRSAASNTASSLASGLPIYRIFAEQGIEVAAAMGAGSGGKEGATGAMAKFAAFMGGPWGLAVQVGVGLLAVLVPKLLESASAADTMAAHQKTLGDIIDRTTGRVKDQNVALLLNQRIQTQADKGTAGQGLDTAKSRLESLLVTPELIAAYGKLHDGQRGALQGFTDVIEAMKGQGPSMTQYVKPLSDALADMVKKGRDVQQVSAQLRILQGQPLPGDRKKAFGDFGADAPDLALADAKAKLAAATNGQERAQAQATITQIQAKKSFDDGAISLGKYTQLMTGAESAIHAADAAQKLQTKSASEAAAQAKRDAAERARLVREMAELNLQPMSVAFGKSMQADADHIFTELDAAQKVRGDMLQTMVRQDGAQRSALASSALELATIGMTADKRQVILDTFAKQQELQRDGNDLESDLAKQILAGVVAQDAMNAQLARASTAMQEVRDFGSQLVDDLASGRSITKDLVAEFIKLAALNPLKNLINGNSALPTLSGGIGAIAKLFGGSRQG
jgi:hypothetical protein